MPANFIVGVDLGQVNDYTAIAVVERVLPPLPARTTPSPPPVFSGGGELNFSGEPMQGVGIVYPPPADTRVASYHLRHLERPVLGTKYTVVVARVKELLSTPPLTPQTPLVIDATGVGRGIFDMFGQAGMTPWGITITGGDQMTREGRAARVPKKDLVGALLAAFHGERLKIAADLPEGATLINELLNFKIKVNIATGNESFEAWREGVHDDLVLAVAMAVWFGENPPRPFT